MKLILIPDHLNLLTAKLKELWQDIELDENSSVQLRALTRLKDDFLTAPKDDNQTELLLLIHAMLWLGKHNFLNTRDICFKIKEDFFSFLDEKNWLGIKISEEEKQWLANIHSVFDPRLIPHSLEEWQSIKNHIYVTICKERLNHITENAINTLNTVQGNLATLDELAELFELQLNIEGQRYSLREEDYKRLIGITYFNMACLHLLDGNYGQAEANYRYAEKYADEIIKQHAKLRLEDFKKNKLPFSEAVKATHQPYVFRNANTFLHAVNTNALPDINEEPKQLESAPKLITEYSPLLISASILAAAILFTVLIAVLAANFGLTLPILAAIGAFLTAPIPSILVPVIAVFSGIMAVSALSTALTEIFMPKTNLLIKEVSVSSEAAAQTSSYGTAQTKLGSEELNVDQTLSASTSENYSSVLLKANQNTNTDSSTDDEYKRKIEEEIIKHQEKIAAKVQVINEAWPENLRNHNYNLENNWKSAVSDKRTYRAVYTYLRSPLSSGASEADVNDFTNNVLPLIVEYNDLVSNKEYRLWLSEKEQMDREKSRPLAMS